MHTTTRFWGVAALCAATLALFGCASDAAPPPSDADVAAFRVSGDEVERYVGFDEMLASADLTVLGTVGEALAIRTVGDRGTGEGYLLPFTVEVEQTISGTAPRPLIVELTLGAADQDVAEATAQDFARVFGGQEVLLYLRAKRGADEKGLYRIVNSAGLWMTTAEENVAAPLFEGNVTTRDEWAGDLALVESLSELVSTVHSDT